jgi:transposase
MRKARARQPHDLFDALRGGSVAERQHHRLHSVALVLAGFSASQAAQVYGDSPRAVAYWVERYKKGGLAGLNEEARPGRPPRLDVKQLQKLRMFVEQTRKKSASVNGDVLAKHIKNSFGITFTTRQCWRILKRLTA